MPHTYALLLFLVAAACMLTYVIPAGSFERQEVDGRTEVVNGSYQQVTQSPVSPVEIFRAVPDGMIAGAEIIFYIFIVGGAFGIIHRTNAINAGVNTMMKRSGRHGK